MKNFEKGMAIIEALRAENQELKEQIIKLSKPDTNIQVGTDSKMQIMTYEKEAAMKRFTERMRNEAIKHKGRRNG